uniref:aralkylamine N-acetyltransferase n=1 Tax=Romanomermis culicivorax TaxID=13658 RepID=A0A915KAL2_ROMCU
MEQQNFRYELAGTDRFEEIVNFLLNNFCKDEPCLQSLASRRNKSHNEFLMRDHMTRVVSDSLKDPVSFICVNPVDNKIIGCRLNVLETRDQWTGRKNEKVDQKLTNYMYKFLDSLRVDLFEMFPDCLKLLKFRILSVEKSFQGRGIGRKLTEISLEAAIKSSGCDYVCVNATAAATQTMFGHMGFQILKTTRHDEFLDDNGCQIFHNADGSTCGMFMYKKLKT